MNKKRKYIDDIGIAFEETPQGLCNDEYIANIEGTRGSLWHKEREIYGFDNRETWNLDYTIKLHLYERLCMYNEINIIDTENTKVEFEGGEITLQECIDRMIEGLKIDLQTDYLDKKRLDTTSIEYKKMNEVFKILSICINRLWW